MGVFDWFTKKETKTVKEFTDDERGIVSIARALGINTPGYFWEFTSGRGKVSSSGQTVDDNTALWLSAFYRGIAIRCDSLNLPISVIKTTPDGREKVTKSDAYEYQVQRLLSVSPSRMHTPAMFLQLLEMSRLMYGNGYAKVLRNGLGVPTALKWIHPDKVKVRIGEAELFYDIEDDKGNKTEGLMSMDMIHVRNTSFDGVLGRSVLEVAADSLGFGLATQEAGNKHFRDGMTSKVVFSHPGHIGATANKNATDSIDSEMKKKSTMVLEEGIKPYVLSVTPEQSQFLQSREFSVSEVSRWLNVPEFMLANNDPTYSNIENFASHYITHTMRPTARMYEQEFNWKLLTNEENFKTRFNLDALNRASMQARAEYFNKAVGGPWLKRDEARELEKVNELGGEFDTVLTPMNMTTNPTGEAMEENNDE
ncbi:MAG: phage portal protein [Nitrosomonadaceae bacterium]